MLPDFRAAAVAYHRRCGISAISSLKCNENPLILQHQNKKLADAMQARIDRFEYEEILSALG